MLRTYVIADKAEAHYFTSLINKSERVSLTTELEDNSIIHVRHAGSVRNFNQKKIIIENEPSGFIEGFIRHCYLVMVTRGKISPTVTHVYMLLNYTYYFKARDACSVQENNA